MDKNQERIDSFKSFDNAYRDEYGIICGIDEAGRGPLAGPVVACAVIMPKESNLLYVNDSKKVSEKRREKLYDDIISEAISYGVGVVSPEIIDEINILQATYKAARLAIEQLNTTPDILLNDALTIPDVAIKQEPIVKGDAKSYSIACASILAKVTRDRLMREYDIKYPGYDFSKHKGYGTKAHYDALRKLGMCPIHRKTFLKKMH